MDKALDDIVKTARTSKRGPGRRTNRSARASPLGATPTTAAKNAARKAAVAPGRAVAPQQTAEKIMVSGLPTDVNQQQIQELFASTVGPIVNCQLHYTPQGKWNGTATVLFSRKGDGSKAYDTYNNRLIDGKKPMRIELIYDPSKVPPPSLASRVAPANKGNAGGARTEGVQRNGGRPRRARGAGPGTGKRNARPPPKTAADLDAEMEDYTAATNTPVVAAPVA